MALRLAWQAGEIEDVDGFLDRMSSQQINEWIAFHRITRFGDDSIHYMIGQLCAIMANAWGKHRSDAFKFIPWMVKPAQTVEEQKAELNRVLGK